MKLSRMEQSFEPAIPLEMYRVSGHGEVDPARYLKDKKQDEAIKISVERMGFVAEIRNVSSHDRAALRLLVQEKITQAFKAGLGNEFVRPPLYDNSNLNTETFRRKAFEKTGSGTTLVGGGLKDKLIIRHITPEAFLAWQAIYENYQVWKENGFDYVPVEPIVSYRLNKKGTVDVFSGVLDVSMDAWLALSGRMFVKELKEQQGRIIGVLDSQNINHGHTHGANFVLRFFRDKNGNPDITKVPRLYVIDFDQAVSS